MPCWTDANSQGNATCSKGVTVPCAWARVRTAGRCHLSVLQAFIIALRQDRSTGKLPESGSKGSRLEAGDSCRMGRGKSAGPRQILTPCGGRGRMGAPGLGRHTDFHLPGLGEGGSDYVCWLRLVLA